MILNLKLKMAMNLRKYESKFSLRDMFEGSVVKCFETLYR